MMYYKNTAPLIRNLPIGLTPKDVADPYLVLSSFFAYSEYLPRHRKRIKRWLIAALDSDYKWKHAKLLRCLEYFEGLARLMEALWLIHQSGDSFTPEDIAVRYDDEKLMCGQKMFRTK